VVRRITPSGAHLRITANQRSPPTDGNNQREPTRPGQVLTSLHSKSLLCQWADPFTRRCEPAALHISSHHSRTARFLTALQ